MITGKVTADVEAIIELQVAGPVQPSQKICAVIDTGYNGYLTLPSNQISAIQLPFAGHRRGTLADDSTVVLNVYLATVLWHGAQREVLVAQAGGAPLVGMAMLRGSRLSMDVVDEGELLIDKLP